MPPRRNPILFREAWDAIRALIRDPDDTPQVFRIIRALSGNSQERSFQRFLASEHGPTILAENRVLLETLSDRAYLESLPEGTLGRAYAEFTAREEITADGLVDASDSVERPEEEEIDERRLLFGQRLRDSHDLWHVVTGYGRDLFGEAALLSFTYRQIRNRGIGFIVVVAYLKARGPMAGERVLIRDGFRRAGRAAWLPGADWEALLERPLDEVRRTLGVVPIEHYEGLRSGGAPALA
ncbi:MAG: ubiquinone biosynthesis protein COQ4 [bacterium]|nr:ubiquinone biosynthesis protein COQ4 [bacterium]